MRARNLRSEPSLKHINTHLKAHNFMKILLLGSGGREHALAWKIAQSPKIEKLYIAPGNAGTSNAGENVDIKADDFEAIKTFVIENSIDMVVEVMGGINPAYTFVKDALLKGKSVATSNKELVAKHGAELLRIAKENKVNFLFEASVGGGIPIIRPLNNSLTADEINEITGILKELTEYQKEAYKAKLRLDIFCHPSFNKEKAAASASDELAEIKRMYVEVIGKKTFYHELVSEIVQEDHSPNKEALQFKVLQKLKVKNKYISHNASGYNNTCQAKKRLKFSNRQAEVQGLN